MTAHHCSGSSLHNTCNNRSIDNSVHMTTRRYMRILACGGIWVRPTRASPGVKVLSSLYVGLWELSSGVLGCFFARHFAALMAAVVVLLAGKADMLDLAGLQCAGTPVEVPAHLLSCMVGLWVSCCPVCSWWLRGALFREPRHTHGPHDWLQAEKACSGGSLTTKGENHGSHWQQIQLQPWYCRAYGCLWPKLVVLGYPA